MGAYQNARKSLESRQYTARADIVSARSDCMSCLKTIVPFGSVLIALYHSRRWIEDTRHRTAGERRNDRQEGRYL